MALARSVERHVLPLFARGIYRPVVDRGAPGGAGGGSLRESWWRIGTWKDRPHMERPMSFDPGAPGLSGQAYGLPHSVDEARVVLVPVPFEATTSYGGGAAEGPAAVLRASAQVDLFESRDRPALRRRHRHAPRGAPGARLELRGEAARRADHRGRRRPVRDAGLARVNAICEELNAGSERTVARSSPTGSWSATVGGDHGSIYGAIAAHAHAYPGWASSTWTRTPDLRDAYEGFTWSHASIFHNVVRRLPEVSRLVPGGPARHLRGRAPSGRVLGRPGDHPHRPELKRRAFDGEPWARQVDRIVHALPEQVYLSFDIDGLDPTLCPHTGTSGAGGPLLP
jgi:agmatinase